jgi:hypothetical protein
MDIAIHERMDCILDTALVCIKRYYNLFIFASIMTKTFNFLLVLSAMYLIGCKKSDSSDLTHETVEYSTTISSVVTFNAYYLDTNEQNSLYYGQLTGSVWTQSITVEKTNFKKAAMTLLIQGTPPFHATSEILVNGVVKKTLNSTFNNNVDTIYLEDPNVWPN